MLEGIYIVVAILMFFGQLKNGLFTALWTAVFWPIWVLGLSLLPFFLAFKEVYGNKKDKY